MILVNMESDKYFNIFLKKKKKNDAGERNIKSTTKLLTGSMHEAPFKQKIFDIQKSSDMPPSKEIEMTIVKSYMEAHKVS